MKRKLPPRGLTALERLAIQSNRHRITECQLWTGQLTPGGYGVIRFEGKTYAAHRLAWMATHGPIPTGKVICHHCDVRHCVNPDHLFLGTHGHNMRDLAHKHRLRRLQLPPALAADQPMQQVMAIVLRGVELLQKTVELLTESEVRTRRSP